MIEDGSSDAIDTVFKSQVFLVTGNVYDGDVEYSADRKILSRKKEGGHGFGLYSMERITEKYHGSLDIKSGEGIFTVEI